jgi:hypothetical protein
MPKPRFRRPGQNVFQRGTAHREFIAVGQSENGDLFLKYRIGQSEVLVSAAGLILDKRAEFLRLQRVGLPLVSSGSTAAFINKAQKFLDENQPTVRVITRIGLHGETFVLPDGVLGNPPAAAETYFHRDYSQYHAKFRRAGTRAGWIELCDLGHGNSRVILIFCLAFSGPGCAAFGLEPPGVQLVGEGGQGATTTAKIGTAGWGCDMDPMRAWVLAPLGIPPTIASRSWPSRTIIPSFFSMKWGTPRTTN